MKEHHKLEKKIIFHDVTFEKLQALDPNVVRSKSLKSLVPFLSSFPTLLNETTVQNIDSEWRLLRHHELVSEEYVTPLQFCLSVKITRFENDDPMFPNL